MKTLTTISLLVAALILCQSCDDDDDYTPPLTGYFYCKINGQNFAAVGAWQCQSRVFNYYPDGFMNSVAGTIILSGRDCANGRSVGLNLYGYNESLDTLNLLDSTAIDSSRAFLRFLDPYTGDNVVFEKLISGKLQFNQFSDKQGDQNGIVSGTFEFTVRNEELDSTVVVTEGRFQYIIDYEWY